MEVKEKNKKLLIVVGVLLLFGGVTLAYFVSKAILGGNGGSTSVTTAVINGATLNVEGILSFEDLDILPGHKTASAIKVTATGNNELIPYNLIWKGTNTLTTPLNFTIYKTSEQLSVTSTCTKKSKQIGSSKALLEECNISNLDKLGNEIASGTINKNETKVTLAKDEFITATSTGDIKYYYIILEYPNLDEPQNEDLNGTFEGEVTVEESNIKPDINILAAYVVQDDGTYKQIEDIPQEGYTINREKSTCSNGAKVRWDGVNNELITSNLTKSETSCYLYFDKYTIGDYILANVTINEGTPDFNQIATTDEGVYAVADGMYGGTSYYWRGASTTNYVKFAGFCWRIIRINGDKTIRLIYEGTTCYANGTSTTDKIPLSTQNFNTSYDKSYYVGWTYTSSQRPSNDVPQTNGTESNAKILVENWYNNNITGINARKITKGKYCNDRDMRSGYTWVAEGTPVSYAGNTRLLSEYSPTLSCSNGDIYELNVGLITADEVEFAGGTNQDNKKYYLYKGKYFWTMTPSFFSSTSSGHAYMYVVNTTGAFSTSTFGTFGLCPVINLKASTQFVLGGDGTLDNPYVVAD